MILKVLNQYIPLRKFFLFGLEALYILAILSLVTLGLTGDIPLLESPEEYIPRALLIVITIQVCLYYFELYDVKVFRSNLELTVRLLQALGISSIILAGFYFFLPFLIIGRGVFLYSLAFIAMAIVVWRLLYNQFLKAQLVDQQVMIVGTGRLARSIAREIVERRDTGFQVNCFIAENSGSTEGEALPALILGRQDQILELARERKVDRIAVALEERRGLFPVAQLLECKMRGLTIDDGVDFYEHLTGKIPVEHIHPSALIFSTGFRKSRSMTIIKRWGDVALSVIGLLLTSPLVLCLALAVKLDSKGPVFYSQERSGKNGKPFQLIKFRSMRTDAEAGGTPVWAGENDPRITRLGRILRKLRLDEIPQMINVIRGEMSFVGPRPERPYFIEQLKQDIPYYDQRLSVKPGLTGWAQINYPYGATHEDAVEKLKYDLYYIKNLSLFMDLFTIFETVKIVLFGKGAR